MGASFLFETHNHLNAIVNASDDKSSLPFWFDCEILSVSIAHIFQMSDNIHNSFWHTSNTSCFISFFQVSNMFIMSLAIADLTVGAIVMPISSAYAITG